jgi:hypothetical protein
VSIPLCLAVAGLTSFAVSGHAQKAEVLTSGFATVTLTPTRATVTLSVATHANSAAGASKANTDKVKVVLAALGDEARLVDSIRVTRIDVSPRQNYETQEILGYEAEAHIEGVVLDLSRVGEVLDVGLQAGATAISGVEYQSDSLALGRAQALQAAFATAQTAAKALANAAGRQLGPLLSVSNVSQTGPLGFQSLGVEEISVRAAGLLGSPSSINPSPSGVQVHAHVTAKWELQ